MAKRLTTTVRPHPTSIASSRAPNPADLPVQLAAKFVLIVNMKAAKTLGITIPISLLGLADRVIE